MRVKEKLQRLFFRSRSDGVYVAGRDVGRLIVPSKLLTECVQWCAVFK